MGCGCGAPRFVTLDLAASAANSVHHRAGRGALGGVPCNGEGVPDRRH